MLNFLVNEHLTPQKNMNNSTVENAKQQTDTTVTPNKRIDYESPHKKHSSSNTNRNISTWKSNVHKTLKCQGNLYVYRIRTCIILSLAMQSKNAGKHIDGKWIVCKNTNVKDEDLNVTEIYWEWTKENIWNILQASKLWKTAMFYMWHYNKWNTKTKIIRK